MRNSRGWKHGAVLLAVLLVALPLGSSSIGKRSADPMRVTISTTNVPLTTVQTVTLVNVTQTGQLGTISCQVTTAPTGTPTANLRINVDAQGVASFALYAGGTTWGITTQGAAVTAPGAGVVDGSALGDAFALQFNTRFNTSLVVDVDLTGAGTAGQLTCTVTRGFTY